MEIQYRLSLNGVIKRKNPGAVTGSGPGEGLPGDSEVIITELPDTHNSFPDNSAMEPPKSRESNTPRPSPVQGRERTARGLCHLLYQMDSEMQDNFYTYLANSISEDRLGPYRQYFDSEPKVYAGYLWNTSLCESLYPALNGLEIALRNSIHGAISGLVGKEFWFEDVLVDNGTKQFDEIRQRWDKKESPTASQVVSGSNFGFWTHLFNRCYGGTLWPQILQPVFPHAPASLRTRRELSKRVNKFRELRNRISHHEPIWYWGDLHITHQEILEVVGWISPQNRALVELIDRFPEIHSRGVSGYEELILGSLTTKA